MPNSAPNIRHARYKELKTATQIDDELIKLSRILHQTESIQMRGVIREDQDYLLDLRNRRLGRTKRGTRTRAEAASGSR